MKIAAIAESVIAPTLHAVGLEWHGWHAFRRGLATNLHDLGVDDKTIQAILRHADIHTTQQIYIKTLPAHTIDAMAKLEEEISKREVVN